MVEVENLVKRYGSRLAVDHLSFQIESGKIYGFLGPNGAGKSTTMNMMTGYIAPTEGTVRIHGYDIIKEAAQAKRYIGYLPEIPPLYQDMTVREYLTFVAELKKVAPKERKEHMKEIMELTMIGDVEGRLIKNLSKGYKQRVGLAQALIGNPEVVILDEPTVGLDPRQILEIRDLIRRLGEKHTVILSSHILSEVQAVCDEIMILSKGRLMAYDTPEELLRQKDSSASIEADIMGEKEKIEQAVGKLPAPLNFRFEDSQEEGCVKLILETAKGIDLRKKLFYLMAEEKFPIMSMNRRERSLEEIFLELTESDNSEGQEPGEGGNTNESNL